MGGSCSRVASAMGEGNSNMSPSPPPPPPIRLLKETPTILAETRAKDGSLTAPSLLDLCVQSLAQNLDTLPTPLQLSPEIAARLVAHLISRSWLDLDALRALKECSLLALELPGFAQLDR